MKILDHLVLLAQGKINPNDVGVPKVTDANAVLSGILGVVYTWAGIIAVLVIIIAGIFYTTSQGDAKRVQRAKEAIIGAVAGLVIIMMAFVITQFILGRF